MPDLRVVIRFKIQIGGWSLSLQCDPEKLAQQIEAEAREKAAALISDAQKQADETIGSITAKKEFEEKRLAAAQAASAKFLDGIRAMCNAQLKNIDNIGLRVPESQSPAEPEEEETEEPVEEEPVLETEAEEDGTRPFTL